MNKVLIFERREAFRSWLNEHHLTHEAIWIRFDKASKLFKANEALEEALCFGWIDSTIKRIDERYYIKYFSKRRKRSHWSEKNKHLVMQLIQKGTMTKEGMKAIEDAKRQGIWDQEILNKDDDVLQDFLWLIKPSKEAYQQLSEMSLSVQKTYARFYFSAKQDSTKKKRLDEIIERLNQGLKPM